MEKQEQLGVGRSSKPFSLVSHKLADNHPHLIATACDQKVDVLQ